MKLFATKFEQEYHFFERNIFLLLDDLVLNCQVSQGCLRNLE